MNEEKFKNELDWLKASYPLIGDHDFKLDSVVHVTVGRIAELLYEHAFGCGRLGAAVSASPQPSVDELAAVMAYQHQSHTPESRKKLWDEETGPWKEQWRRTAQIVIERFFAAAPAHTEPDYNRAYTILGEALNLNPEFYGLVEMAQVAAKRLTGKYDVAAQEQPVENSPQRGICKDCGADRSGPSAEAHDEGCPQKGKP